MLSPRQKLIAALLTRGAILLCDPQTLRRIEAEREAIQREAERRAEWRERMRGEL